MHEMDSLEELQEWISEDTVLVDIWAPWCQPCKKMEPILREIDSEWSAVSIVTVNADKHPEIVQYLGVTGVPTYFLYKDGQQAASVVGAKPKSKFVEELGIG